MGMGMGWGWGGMGWGGDGVATLGTVGSCVGAGKWPSVALGGTPAAAAMAGTDTCGCCPQANAEWSVWFRMHSCAGEHPPLMAEGACTQTH